MGELRGGGLWQTFELKKARVVLGRVPRYVEVRGHKAMSRRGRDSGACGS